MPSRTLPSLPVPFIFFPHQSSLASLPLRFDFMVHTFRSPLVNIVTSPVSLSFPHITGKTSILDELNKPHPPCLNPGSWTPQPKNTKGLTDVTIILRSLAYSPQHCQQSSYISLANWLSCSLQGRFKSSPLSSTSNP